jgi:hypothetical protein
MPSILYRLFLQILMFEFLQLTLQVLIFDELFIINFESLAVLIYENEGT